MSTTLLSPIELTARLASIEQQLIELNSALGGLSDSEKRRHGLYEHYALGAYGGVIYCNGGSKAVYDPMRTGPAERARIYHRETDRNAYRDECRRARMPERMIWDRWPAYSAEEEREKIERLQQWDEIHPPPGGKWQPAKNGSVGAFELFVRKEAGGDRALAAQKNFRDECRAKWDSIEDFQIEL